MALPCPKGGRIETRGAGPPEEMDMTKPDEAQEVLAFYETERDR